MRGRRRILRLLAGDACAVALTAFAFLAAAFEASAQTNPLGSALGPPPQLVFSRWVKLCSESADPARRRCFTSRDSRSENGEWPATAAIVEMDDGKRKYFALKMPDGVVVQIGAWLTVDRGRPWTAPSVTCISSVAAPGGYVAFCVLPTELIERMKSGQVLMVQGSQSNGKPVNVQFDLQGFAMAFDGPPTEFREFVKQQRMRPNEPQMRIRDDTLQPHLRPRN